jgi:hypothetical protein
MPHRELQHLRGASYLCPWNFRHFPKVRHFLCCSYLRLDPLCCRIRRRANVSESVVQDSTAWPDHCLHYVATRICRRLSADRALQEPRRSPPIKFLAGFAGSPHLATGGASPADIWALEDRAVVTGLWSLAAVCGPVLGPVLGGFAARAEGWTWTIWILLWFCGGSLIYLVFSCQRHLLKREFVFPR